MQVHEYVARRLLKLPLVLFVVTVAVFGLSRMGGSPAGIYIEHEMSLDEIHEIEARYGLDKPLPVQYLAWVGGVLRGDLGWSGVSVAPVSEVLPARFMATMELATCGMLIGVTLGVGLGTFAGARRNRLSDHAIRVLTVSGASLPQFWFALLMLILFYLVIPIAPLGRFDPATYSQISHYTGIYTLDSVLNGNPQAFLDAIRHLALPAFVLGFTAMAIIGRMMRSSLVEEMGEDYVDSARAKGLSERRVTKHARRNALVPTVTQIGLTLAILLQGSIVVEAVFRWPGLGRWVTEAVLRGDRASIMGFVLVMSVVYLLVNLVVDVIYAHLDRRIELGAG